jgi:ketosteroid isomerase-like protein
MASARADTRHGRAQVAQFFTAVSETLEILEFEPRTFLAHDDTVVVCGYERALAKPTNRTFESEWVMVFTLHAGQVVRFRAYHDTAAAHGDDMPAACARIAGYGALATPRPASAPDRP